MAVNDMTQLLAQCPSFRGLQTTDLQAVLQAAHHRRVQRNAFFFHQGDPASTFYVLARGEAKLTQVTPEGHQMLVRFAGPGECFGGIAVMGNEGLAVACLNAADVIVPDVGSALDLLLWPRRLIATLRT